MNVIKKFNQLTWKIRLAIVISVLWFLFWMLAGLEEEAFFWGLGFGGFPILLFWGFCLMAIHPGKEKDAAVMENIEKIAKERMAERREFARLEYPDTKRPLLKYGEYEFPIINISERGLKLFNEKRIKIDHVVNGEAVLLSGRSIIVNGKASWSLSYEFGLLMDPISTSIITEEKGILAID
ncbi:MAG: PilZ domain-containing protein [Desulfobacterales bacterium]|nr:MAG: PilZ domain-containing protein [Desulfobacterales bacterium]